jgi:hypothetical protein|tara:strand:+ start:2861 stop:3211 length:351 start_codon:yes stop_codon:yes gene_type:complete
MAFRSDFMRRRGTSVYYVTGDAKIGFYPTPAASTAIKIFYVNRPAVMSADATNPEIDSQYHDALAFYAAARVSELTKNFDQAAYFQMQWERLKQRAVEYGHKKSGETSFNVDYNDF